MRGETMKTALPRLLAMGMVIALLVSAGCASAVVGPEGESWLLESYGDAASPEAPPAGVEASAEFEDGQVTGSAGCNRYFGAYETDGSDITIGPVAATEMWCESPEGAMDLEQAFLAAISTAETFEVEDGELRIDYPGGVLAFTAR
jgi:heat shock protein HslJ